jgi:FkbH-like protein
VIWDLDDTLWQGTLADGDEPVLDEKRAGFVRALNRHGIVSAICSKNDLAAARAKLEGFGLWDEFVFPRVAFVPKGAVVKAMIADMQLRPANVLFIDDNSHNLREVADSVPGIQVVDATSPECDALLERIIGENAHIEKNRIGDYRLLETKATERDANELSDEAFLMQSGIHATFTDRMDNLEFAARMEELINRSNQLNYTQSRIEPGTMLKRIQDIDYYEVLSAFVWDKYGYYGLVGVAVYAFRTRTLEHFAFSCRIMHMGVEDAMIRMLAERGYPLDAAQMKKPLPPQSARAITTLSYADPAVRARVLAEEAPRDWDKLQLRVMADCQSGAFHHYSRFGDEMDFDNNPRLFSLPQMVTGEYAEQRFPRYLAYAAASDYTVWRWAKLTPDRIDMGVYRECADRFTDMVVRGDHRCLIFLPQEDLPLAMYELHLGCVREEAKALHPGLNGYWRDAAARHPAHFTLVELADMLVPEDLVHAHHYVPSALQRIAGVIDDWYAGETGR